MQAHFGLGPSALAAITSAVQLGFICGTLVFAVLNVSDRFSPRLVFLACSLLGAMANASITVIPAGSHSDSALMAARFLTGFFLAGIYPVGMRIAAGWYREGLGKALGFLVGALVIGTAFPHLLRGLGETMSWATVTVWLSLVASSGGVLMYWLVPDGPYLPVAAAFDPRALVTVFRSPQLRASAFGYFGHMWELYTLWALTPALFAAHRAMHGVEVLNASLASFVVIAAGFVGCAGGGLLSLRIGSARVAFAQLSLSGLCCLLSPLAFLAPAPLFLAFMIFWGVVVVGDSPQFSALTAAMAPRDRVGSALTIVNCIGFALTIASIQLAVALTQDLEARYWFLPVAIGPALGLFAFRRMLRHPV